MAWTEWVAVGIFPSPARSSTGIGIGISMGGYGHGQSTFGPSSTRALASNGRVDTAATQRRLLFTNGRRRRPLVDTVAGLWTLDRCAWSDYSHSSRSRSRSQSQSVAATDTDRDTDTAKWAQLIVAGGMVAWRRKAGKSHASRAGRRRQLQMVMLSQRRVQHHRHRHHGQCMYHGG